MEKILKRPKSKNNIVVYDQDTLIVTFKPNIIQIIGEINSPGYYTYTKTIKVAKVIKNAGGFTTKAEKNVYVQYPNGNSKRYRKIFFKS